jgi:catechol 2,3-dioxygenase-like lactoylglutathione lyase family enzyme
MEFDEFHRNDSIATTGGVAKESTMIRGVHTMFYTSQPDELRAFLRDKLGLPFTDVGQGWLIFDLPEVEMGCHPADAEAAPSGTHYISFYCDDVKRTVAELKGRGVQFKDDIQDAGYGLITHFTMPGEVTVQLYQPRSRKKSAAPKKPALRKPKATARKKPAPRQAQTGKK